MLSSNTHYVIVRHAAQDASSTYNSTLSISVVAQINVTLSYPITHITYDATQVGTSVMLTPVASSAYPMQHSITPALPLGLELDASTGVISGIPRVLTPVITYTMTRTVASQSSNSSISISITHVIPQMQRALSIPLYTQVEMACVYDAGNHDEMVWSIR